MVRVCVSVGWGLAAVLAPLHLQAASDPEQLLRYQYADKTLVLRNFSNGERLRYDSAGSLASGSAVPGDWTVDGFIRVTSLSVRSRLLTVEAERLTFGNNGQSFELRRYFDRKEEKDRKKERKLRIEIEFYAGDITAEKADAVLSKIFLTAQDRLSEVVPPYWKSCVLAASDGNSERQYNSCRFPPEFAFVPGIFSSAQESPEPGRMAATDGQTRDVGIFVVGKGMTPPKVVSQRDPEFSKEARDAKYQGTVVMSLVVSKAGEARDISIVRPLGFGLDQKAVEAVAKWRFDPAKKDGEAVAAQIMVEVDFHLY